MQINSTPTLGGFSPDVIPYQRQVVDLVDGFGYHAGTPEILLSGSYGSAKTTLIAHLVVRHCLEFKRARAAICRRALPDLKRTLFMEIMTHIEEDLVEGKDYSVNYSGSPRIRFSNGSEIICATWADKKYKKFRSLNISCLAIEEIVENDDDDMEAFKTLKARLRRLPHVPQNFCIAATNPEGEGHWVYKYWIQTQPHPTRFVFYSNTEQNPFIDQIYVQQLKADLSPKEAERYVYGRWVDLIGETIYSEYRSETQFRRERDYKVNPEYPVILSWDFNAAADKPMSMVCLQYIEDCFHVFAEVIIFSSRTQDTLDELIGRDLLKPEYSYAVCGDASGKHRDTRSLRSDYDIIMKFLSGHSLRYDYRVPAANPPIRLRHNRLNAYCKNALGDTRLYIYKGCDTLDEGLRLTKLKPGGQFVEDDSKPYQHVTTSLGYAIVALTSRRLENKQGTVEL
jgi:hypothetical protein